MVLGIDTGHKPREAEAAQAASGENIDNLPFWVKLRFDAITGFIEAGKAREVTEATISEDGTKPRVEE